MIDFYSMFEIKCKLSGLWPMSRNEAISRGFADFVLPLRHQDLCLHVFLINLCSKRAISLALLLMYLFFFFIFPILVFYSILSTVYIVAHVVL